MRLAMAAPSVKFPDTLGQTTHQWALAKGLAAKGIEVHLYCRRPKGLPAQEAGVHYHPVFSAEFPGKRPFFTASCRRHLARDNGRRPYDLIHDRGYLFGGAGGAVGRAAGVEVVLQIDDNWPLSEGAASRLARSRFYQATALRSCFNQLANATSGFAVSATLKAQAADWHPAAQEMLEVIPNGADLARFNPQAEPLDIRERLGLPSETKLALFVGALGPWHGTDQLQGVAQSLATLDPPAHVLIAGGGGEKWASGGPTAGQPPNLHWLGRLELEEIPRLMVECQAGLAPYPNRDFGFSPLKIFEYFACGLPVAASDLPSVREVVAEGRTGLLAPPGDGAGLGEATARLLTETELARDLATAGLEAARTTYNWEAIVESLIRLYERTLEGGSGGSDEG